MATPISKPGLTPLQIYSGSVLLTQLVGRLIITGSGVSVNVGRFNDVTLVLSGSTGGASISASYATTASFAETALTASYLLGTVVSASYAITSSFAETASYALRVDGGTF